MSGYFERGGGTFSFWGEKKKKEESSRGGIGSDYSRGGGGGPCRFQPFVERGITSGESVAIKHCFPLWRRRGGGGFAFNKPECFERIFSRKFLVNGNLPFLHCSSSCLPLPLFGVIARIGVPEFREKLGGGGDVH